MPQRNFLEAAVRARCSTLVLEGAISSIQRRRPRPVDLIILGNTHANVGARHETVRRADCRVRPIIITVFLTAPIVPVVDALQKTIRADKMPSVHKLLFLNLCFLFIPFGLARIHIPFTRFQLL